MKILSICKTVKKKHKSKKKWKKKKFNKSNNKKFSTLAFDKVQSLFSEMTGNCFWNNYYCAFQWRNNYLNFWNASNHMRMSPIIYKNNFSFKEKNDTENIKVKQESCANEVQECIRNFNCITLDSAGESSCTHSQIPERDDNSDNSNEFEVSEEMIEFMEINMRHKADLAAEKESLRKLRQEMELHEAVNERDDIEECKIPTEASVNFCRNKEMSNLYGKAAPMIHGMETALQLTFNWNCDHHKPEYWPILPFTFKFDK